ncbi:MAG: tyrosine-type recombinase/integrase [Rhodospirillales bacterium]|nr:tyrosine-type recombinase/integrase [Rhodospirillales bacterium]
MFSIFQTTSPVPPWNKGKLIGQKRPLTVRHVWEVRTFLRIRKKARDLALFNFALDSKLRGCDVVAAKMGEIAPNGYSQQRAVIRQKKTGRPVKFELTNYTRSSIDLYLKYRKNRDCEYLFPGQKPNEHLTTRQYSRLLHGWLKLIDLDPSEYGTHSLRRTKATMIYRQTGNLRAVQLLLGHSKIESTVRYLGVDMDDALELSEKVDI